MRMTPEPPGLPGRSASTAARTMAMLMGAIALAGFVPVVLLYAFWSGERGVRLPWPALQWALTTPAGGLVSMLLCLLVIGPPYILYSLSYLRRQVGRAIDVTVLPPAAWPGPLPPRLRMRSLCGWLGHGRSEQVLSLASLALGILLGIGLLGAFVVSGVYMFTALGRVDCGPTGCPPVFPVTTIALASSNIAIAFTE